MARLRLGYTKSRNGCLRCKQRRVKCDEQRPCRACVRHGVECSLTASRSSSEAPSTQRARTASPATQTASLAERGRPLQPSAAKQLEPQHLPSALSPPSYVSPPPLTTSQPLGTPSDPYPYFAKFIPSPCPQPYDPVTASWVSDLSLLHHFTTATAKTLFRTGATADERENLWKVDVPRIAFSPGHTFLLHEILATAAFHLAFLEPHNRGKYHVQASQHQTVAIQGVRIAVENITSENCHAIFAASSLFFISALAAARPDGKAVKGVTVDDFVDVFLLVKGIGGVLDSAAVDLKKGPFGKLFIPTRQEVMVPSLTLDRVVAQLDVFLERVKMLGEGDEVRRVVELEVGQLKMCVEKATAATLDPEYRVIASFPIVMTEAFVSMLRGRNRVALALLGYYCVVVHATEKGVWFTKGWGSSILQDIARDTGSPWDQDLAWAMGWISGHEGAEQV
ncbi:sterol uptake control protein 2 [Podospora aff. communis PSN243]|uniref:Sterol uptake control protein 2 n=1 Tax=Podospora aff. communis PSN243 TaxID=3040156 RepID=A0AAV9GFZ4_9PEZI|nr:sterol uptake control protein 2 [Podospora aff. communis PSN243]